MMRETVANGGQDHIFRHPVGLGDNIDFPFEGNHMNIIDLCL